MKKNEKIEQMLQVIRNRRGVAHLSDKISDEQADFFLQEILNCPDCIDEAQRAARLPTRRPRKDH